MDIKDIQEDSVFEDYLEEKQLRPRTIELYTYHMLKFCNVTGMTPTQLLEEAEDEEEERIPLRKTKLKEHLKDFELFLNEQGYSKRHQETSITSIRNFYSWHDIQLPKPRPNKTKKTHETIEDIPSKEEIKEALTYCNPKYKAIILLMASSGMGSAEIRSLKVQDFLDSLSEYFRSPLKLPLDMPQIRKKLENKLVIPTFKIVRVKIALPYTTFATPEAVNAILYFLEKYPPQTPDDYLFPTTIKNKEKPITDNAFGKYFNRVNNRCDFGHVNRSVKFHSHSLHKYFASTLINKDIKQWSIDAMLGHAIKNRTTNAYFKPDPTIIKNDYFKIVKDLSMEEIEVKTMDSPEFQELRDKYQKDSMAKAEQIALMEKEIEEMKKRNKERDKILDDIVHEKDIMEKIIK